MEKKPVKRAPNECPSCCRPGDVDLSKGKRCDADGNRLVLFGKPTDWKCEDCKLEWNINEDFKCIFCGKEVPGRFLFCESHTSEEEG